MRFGLLGPLELTRDGAPVRLPGTQQPRVLVALLDEANRVVPTHRLAAAMWDGEPPATADRQVRNLIGRLRREAGLPPDRLFTAGAGYRLAVEAADLDVLRCETRVAEARRRRDGGDHAQAVTAFDAALAEWRGPSLAGLTGRFAEAIAARLDELRLSITEERVEAMLDMGHGASLVSQLRTLVAEHPLRQRFTAQLMLALHRCGRTAEALEAFVHLRGLLAEELGIDPGESVRLLHTAILRGEPTLSPAPIAATAIAVPAQLPADVPGFMGRRKALATLDRRVEAGRRVLITGPGGIGKTALAVRWARLNRERFTDGQLYVNLRGFDDTAPLRPGQALTHLLRGLGVAADGIPPDVDSAAALFRSLTDGRSLVLLLDNARDADQVRPLLPGSAGVAVLITSRHRMPGLVAVDGVRPVGLEPLAYNEAIALMSDLVDDGRLGGDAGAAEALADLCDRLPLALRIVSARLAGEPRLDVAEFAHRLRAAQGVEGFSLDGDARADLAASFDLSVAALSPSARDLFLTIGVIPGGRLPRALIAAAAGDGAAVDSGLDALRAAHLVQRPESGRYVLHDLVRSYASHRAASELTRPRRDAIADRVIDWYFTDPRIRGPEEYVNIAAAVESLRDHPRCWKLGVALTRHGDLGVDLVELQEIADNAFSTADGGPASAVHIQDALARVAHHRGDHATAVRHARAAWDLSRDIPDADDDGVLLSNLGRMLYGAGEYAEAETFQRAALEAAERPGHAVHLDSRLRNLGNLLRATGRFAEAETLLLRAERAAGDRRDDTYLRVCEVLGNLHADMGRLDDAERWLRRVLAADAAPTQRTSDLAVIQLGEVLRRLGRLDEAESALRDGLERAEVARRHVMADEARIGLALVHCDLGRPRDGMVVLSQLSPIGGRSLDRSLLARRALARARCRLALGETDAAHDLALEAVRVCEESSRTLLLARAEALLAQILEAAADVAAAREHRGRSREVLAHLGLPDTEAITAV